MIGYDPANWYWIVGNGPTNQVYASVSGHYVPVSDATYQTWLTVQVSTDPRAPVFNRPSRIDTEASLGDVLAVYVETLTVKTSTVLVIAQALKQMQLDLLLIKNADMVKLVQNGQSTTTSGAGISQFLSTSTNNYRSLRAQIAAATTAAQVQAIAINSGWPANP